MTKIILETDNDWTIKKIKSAINTEAELLRKAVIRSQTKLEKFEMKYGKLNRDTLYGKIDDMELLEWEGEVETMLRLEKNLSLLEEITIEYR